MFLSYSCDGYHTSWLAHLQQKQRASFALETLSSLCPELFGGAWLVVTNSDKDHTSVKIKLQCPDCVVLIWAEVLCQGIGSIYQFSSALSLCLSSLRLTIISMWLKAYNSFNAQTLWGASYLSRCTDACKYVGCNTAHELLSRLSSQYIMQTHTGAGSRT